MERIAYWLTIVTAIEFIAWMMPLIFIKWIDPQVMLIQLFIFAVPFFASLSIWLYADHKLSREGESDATSTV